MHFSPHLKLFSRTFSPLFLQDNYFRPFPFHVLLREDLTFLLTQAKYNIYILYSQFNLSGKKRLPTHNYTLTCTKALPFSRQCFYLLRETLNVLHPTSGHLPCHILKSCPLKGIVNLFFCKTVITHHFCDFTLRLSC